MKKMPIFVSLIVSTVILFGGWYLYQDYFVEKPIKDYVASLEGVQIEDIVIQREQISVEISFSDAGAFLIHYSNIYEKVKQYARGKQVDLRLPAGSEDLKEIWNEGYFTLAEILEHRQYSRIPDFMDSLKEQYGLDKAEAKLDQHYLYIVIEKNDQISYRVMPRSVEVNT